MFIFLRAQESGEPRNVPNRYSGRSGVGHQTPPVAFALRLVLCFGGKEKGRLDWLGAKIPGGRRPRTWVALLERPHQHGEREKGVTSPVAFPAVLVTVMQGGDLCPIGMTSCVLKSD